MRVSTPHIAIVTIGCWALIGITMAQQSPEIVVEAPHRPANVAKTAPGSKELLPEVSVSHRVKYSDLDLSTHSGAVELEKRIRDSATEACQQLSKLYPGSTQGEGKESCVDGAVKKAMEQANKAIAAAEKSKK